MHACRVLPLNRRMLPASSMWGVAVASRLRSCRRDDANSSCPPQFKGTCPHHHGMISPPPLAAAEPIPIHAHLNVSTTIGASRSKELIKLL